MYCMLLLVMRVHIHQTNRFRPGTPAHELDRIPMALSTNAFGPEALIQIICVYPTHVLRRTILVQRTFSENPQVPDAPFQKRHANLTHLLSAHLHIETGGRALTSLDDEVHIERAAKSQSSMRSRAPPYCMLKCQRCKIILHFGTRHFCPSSICSARCRQLQFNAQ